MTLIRFAPILLAGFLSPAYSGQYQDAINKAFPGYQILGQFEIKLYEEEMNRETYAEVKNHPGLAVGKFNSDSRADFAALIREPIKKQGPRGDYYDGYLVVCYGLVDGKFDCIKVSPISTYAGVPFGWFLIKIPPGKHFCHVLMKLDAQKKSEDDEKYDTYITTRSDSIGYFRTMGNGDIMYAYQGKKTMFSQCILSD